MDLSYSFVIPARNSSETISATIDSILNLKGPFKFDIVVVDNASVDRTKEAILKYPNCRYFYCDNVGRSYARNLGASVCKGDFLLFIDSDVVLESDWLIQVDKYLNKYDLDMLATAIIPEGENRSIVDLFRKTYSKWKSGGTSLSFHKRNRIIPLVNSAACAIKKRSFLAVGGFSVQYERNEDFELSIRMFYEGYLLGGTSLAKSRVYFNPHLSKTSFSRGLNYLIRFYHIGYFSLFPNSKLRFELYSIQNSNESKNRKVGLLIFSTLVLSFYKIGGFLAKIKNKEDYQLPKHRNGPKTLRFCFSWLKSQYILDRSWNVVFLESEPYLFNGFFSYVKTPPILNDLFLNPSNFKPSEFQLKALEELKVFKAIDVS